jgi:hypothetical protein
MVSIRNANIKIIPGSHDGSNGHFGFNCNFGSIYDQQEKVFDRKPFNRTKALDFLRNLIIRKDKGGQNKQNEK